MIMIHDTIIDEHGMAQVASYKRLFCKKIRAISGIFIQQFKKVPQLGLF